MAAPLNTPERIRKGLASVHDRIDAIDGVLGTDRVALFSEAVAALLHHIEPDLPGLVAVIPDRRAQAGLVAGLIHAAAEFDTAWNNVRLGNAPAAQRQGRVATEFVAAAVLQGIPLEVVNRLPQHDRVQKLLRKHAQASVAELMTPSVSADGRSVVPARLLSMHAFHSFVALVEDFPGVSSQDVGILREYRRSVQNAASHGSSELIAYHFEGAEPGTDVRGGAFFDERRADTYRAAAEHLIGLVQMMTRFLEATTDVIRAEAAV